MIDEYKPFRAPPRGLMAPGQVRAGLMAPPEPAMFQGLMNTLYPQGWAGGIFGIGNPLADWSAARSTAANTAYGEAMKRTENTNAANAARVRALVGDPRDNPILAGWGPADIGAIAGIVKSVPGGMFEVPITNKAGQDVGQIFGDANYDSMRVHHGFIDEAAERGQGYGLKAYQELADHTLAQGKTLRSDVEVTLDAARMYEALERRGYKIERNPNAKIEDVGGVKKWVAPPRSWGVFRVVSGPKVPE
jgi:hypothetical protein